MVMTRRVERIFPVRLLSVRQARLAGGGLNLRGCTWNNGQDSDIDIKKLNLNLIKCTSKCPVIIYEDIQFL